MKFQECSVVVMVLMAALISSSYCMDNVAEKIIGDKEVKIDLNVQEAADNFQENSASDAHPAGPTDNEEWALDDVENFSHDFLISFTDSSVNAPDEMWQRRINWFGPDNGTQGTPCARIPPPPIISSSESDADDEVFVDAQEGEADDTIKMLIAGVETAVNKNLASQMERARNQLICTPGNAFDCNVQGTPSPATDELPWSALNGSDWLVLCLIFLTLILVFFCTEIMLFLFWKSLGFNY